MVTQIPPFIILVLWQVLIVISTNLAFYSLQKVNFALDNKSVSPNTWTLPFTTIQSHWQRFCGDNQQGWNSYSMSKNCISIITLPGRGITPIVWAIEDVPLFFFWGGGDFWSGLRFLGSIFRAQIFGVEFLWSHLLLTSFNSSLVDLRFQYIFSFVSQDPFC